MAAGYEDCNGAANINKEKTMSLPDIISIEHAKTIKNYLETTRYKQLQFIPFKEHGNLYKAYSLPFLLEEEKKRIASLTSNIPIHYDHTFSISYYERITKISIQDKMLGKIFLHNQAYNVSELYFMDKDLADVIVKYSEETNSGMHIFNFRIIPVDNLLILADRLENDSLNSIFFFRDSFLLSYYILRNCNFEGKHVADIGSGSGVQTLFSALKKANKVTSIDVNQRSEIFCKLNMLLNNIDVDHSYHVKSYVDYDFSCDVVVANPPYMFLPDGGRCCENGGEHYGLEHVINIYNKCIDLGIELIMIFSTPISKGKSYFEQAVKSRKVYKKYFIELDPLIQGITTHDYLLRAGFNYRELLIVHIVKK